MFSGIVSHTGEIRRREEAGCDLRLFVDAGADCRGQIGLGDSVAVDGVCLTVTGIDGDELSFDVSRETLSRTLLGSRMPGERVNIELALLPTTRLGGHFVTGHVDGIGRLEAVEPVGSSIRLRFAVPAQIAPFIAEKGSVCIDGISLTVNAVADRYFDVNIVPHTAQATTVKDYEPGRSVHVEVDIIARYLARYLDSRAAAPAADADGT
jgi:riboflavin synthase